MVKRPDKTDPDSSFGRIFMWVAVALVLAIVLLQVPASATSYGARWHNGLELADDRIDTTRPFLSAYEDLGLYARKISGSDFSAFANLSFTNHFGFIERNAFEIDHLYLEWADPERPLDFRAGRQRIFGSVTDEYLDGIALRVRPVSSLELLGFGGLNLPSRYDPAVVVTSRDSAAVNYGVRADARFEFTHVGMAFQHKLTGRGETLIQTAMINGDQQLGRFGSLYGMFAWNFTQNAIHEFEAGTRLSPVEPLTLEIDYRGDYARIDTSSLFGDKVFADYRELRLRLLYLFTPDFSVSMNYAYRDVAEGDLPAHTAGIRSEVWQRGSLGYQQEWGLAGISSRVDGTFEVVRTDLIHTGLGGYFRRYDVSGDGKSPLTAWAANVYAALDPLYSWWSARARVEAAGNHLYDYDVRFFLETVIEYARFVR